MHHLHHTSNQDVLSYSLCHSTARPAQFNGNAHTAVLLLFWNLSGTTRVSRYQKGKTRKGKTKLDLLEQEIVSSSGICWAICKSAPHPRQPHQHPTTQFFTGWMPFLPPNQQCQSTEGNGNALNDYLRFSTYTHMHTHTHTHTSVLQPSGLRLGLPE